MLPIISSLAPPLVWNSHVIIMCGIIPHCTSQHWCTQDMVCRVRIPWITLVAFHLFPGSLDPCVSWRAGQSKECMKRKKIDLEKEKKAGKKLHVCTCYFLRSIYSNNSFGRWVGLRNDAPVSSDVFIPLRKSGTSGEREPRWIIWPLWHCFIHSLSQICRLWWWLKHSVETLARFSELKLVSENSLSINAGANWEATTSTL